MLLFLCTGNYYRSRFAEILFNVLVRDMHLNWRAESRGIALNLGAGNSGPISSFALHGLNMRGITLEKELRFPAALKEQELENADCIIALDETEHRTLLQQRFPLWTDRVSYWNVPDLDRIPAEAALAEIEKNVRELIRNLGMKI